MVGALVDARAQPLFGWMQWQDQELYRSGGAMVDAPLADVLRMITVIVRGERFCDGTIGSALDSGVLIAAAERVLAALDRIHAA